MISYPGRITPSRAIDPVTGRTIFAVCWLAATFGCATLQFRLYTHMLAIVSLPLHTGLLVALQVVFWCFGGLLGNRWRPWGRSGTLVWGGLTIIGWGTLWLLFTYASLSLQLGMLAGFIALFPALICCGVLGGLSSTWMAVSRPWSVDMQTGFIGAALAVAALVVAWLYPSWSELLGIGALLPLMIFDSLPMTWIGSTQPTIGISPGLEKQSLPAGWWWRWWRDRGQLLLTLTSLGMNVVIGALFAVFPTTFALLLIRHHLQSELLWLLAGQSCSLVFCLIALSFTRRLIGAPDCPWPTRWRRKATLLAGWAFAGIATGLIAFSFSASAWLIPSFMLYNLAFTSWIVIVPRLLPTVRSEQRDKQRLVPFQWLCQDNDRFARYEQLREREGQKCLSFWQPLSANFIFYCAMASMSSLTAWIAPPQSIR